MALSPVIAGENHILSNTPSKQSTSDELLNSFMTLLVAQVKNQDPANPMDNNQLTAQLAQFQTSAGIEKLNHAVSDIGSAMNSMKQMNMTDWVSRSVLVAGQSAVSTHPGGNQTFSFALNSDVEEATVTLTDNRGNTYQGKVKDARQGVNTYQLSDIVEFIPHSPLQQSAGIFNLSYSAMTPEGNAPTITALKRAKVESVALSDSASAVLQLGLDGTAKLDEIYLVQ